MIGQWIVRVADLIEAEGRLAKRGVFRLAVAILAAAAAIGLLMIGALVIAAAVYLSLRRALPADAACAVIGVGLVIVGGVCAVVAGQLGSSR